MRSFFDKDGNLQINNASFNKYSERLGREIVYWLYLKAKNNPYTQKELRKVLGISRTTEWRYKKALKAKGYL